ncbi:MAG: DUF3482 domain-containing protein [Deltaproteobacteria bacterium]|nr:DUF3482 domain-containing protein [Deltaproteobacteria bacterium]
MGGPWRRETFSQGKGGGTGFRRSADSNRPIDNIQFIYILLDRALIFYSHIINWAHGRRDYPPTESSAKGAGKAGLTFEWDDKKKRGCQSFYVAIRSNDGWKKELSRKVLKEMLQEILFGISQSKRVYGVVEKS